MLEAATLDAALGSLGAGDAPAVAIASLEGDDAQVLGDLETILRWRARLPQTKWVVLCPSLRPPILLAALRSGVDGLFHVDISEDVLRRAVELVMLGQVLFPVELTHLLLDGLRPDTTDKPIFTANKAEPPPQYSFDRGPGEQVPLSPREHQILQCLVAGHPNKVIARELDIAEATVKVHIKGLLRKVKATNRTQAAIWAMNQRPAPVSLGGNVVKLPPVAIGTEARTAGVSMLPRTGLPLTVGLATGD